MKCPDSGEGDRFRLENLKALTSNDEVKFVIARRRDYEFARDFTRDHRLDGKVANVIFSPAFAKMLPEPATSRIAWSIRAEWLSGLSRTD